MRKIDVSLAERGYGALKGQMVKKAALSRVFGFEIMPAPFVVAHLQVGLVLQQLGVTRSIRLVSELSMPSKHDEFPGPSLSPGGGLSLVTASISQNFHWVSSLKLPFPSTVKAWLKGSLARGEELRRCRRRAVSGV